MSPIGVPGSLDGPPLVLGEVVVRFLDPGGPELSWPSIPGRSQREVIEEAVHYLQTLLDDPHLDVAAAD